MIYTNFQNEKEIEEVYKNKPIYKYGSANSIDFDGMIFVDDVSNKQYWREVGHYITKTLNIEINFCVIKDGQIIESLKGIPQVVNNSFYYTYNLHSQNTLECPVKTLYNNTEELKHVETVRSLLASISRSGYRSLVKPSLNSNNMEERIEVLKEVDFNDLEKIKLDHIDISMLKSCAFVLGQSLTFLKKNKEIYTKGDIIDNIPDLKSMIHRENNIIENRKMLHNLKNELCNLLTTKYSFEKINDTVNVFINKENNKKSNICLFKERIY